MERIEPDQTPSQTWKANLDATCNRLMSHYLSLLRAGTSDVAEGEENDLGRDSRGVCFFVDILCDVCVCVFVGDVTIFDARCYCELIFKRAYAYVA